MYRESNNIFIERHDLKSQNSHSGNLSDDVLDLALDAFNETGIPKVVVHFNKPWHPSWSTTILRKCAFNSIEVEFKLIE